MCCNCVPRSGTVTKRCRSAFSISPAAWPVAAQRGHVAKLDSKRAKGRAKAGVEPAGQSRLRAAAVRPRIPRARSKASPSARSWTSTLRRSQAARRHRHQQGPRHRRRHGAAQHGRPAGLARREESPPPLRLDRPVAIPRPRPQGPAHGRPARQRSGARSRNLPLVRIDAENNLMLVDGAVPGPNGGYVMISANEQG